jgi:diketogulonate reductase-like aldo/keto reductase
MIMNKLTDAFTLNNGLKIPCIGFGTYKISDGEPVVSAVKKALEVGYRHIDTAAIYNNEKGVGQAVRQSGLKREEVFITSKVFNPDRGYHKTLAAFEKSLNELQTDYLDLYLIHWPASPKQFDNWEEINCDTWLALTELYRKGKAKSIGVSNFLPHHLKVLVGFEVVPMVNQIEYHPGQIQKETTDFCKEKNILIEAWGPLGRGKMLSNPDLILIAQKYNKSVAQLCIRWCLQNGVLPLPKTVTPGRIQQNSEVFDFTIADNDMQTINNMEYFGGSGLHPDKIDF